MDQLDLHSFLSQELARPRYDDPRRLTRSGYKVLSQADEDGIIAEIFRRIGTLDKSFIEFGLQRGVECNTSWLLMQGWHGLWIEGSAKYCDGIKASHRAFIEKKSLTLCNAFIDASNINDLIGSRFKDREVDLLSIDIDYNDFWIWKAIDRISPRVVIVEYNATWRPPAAMTVPYVPDARATSTNYFGASLSALSVLAEQKGYRLVGCSFSGVNAFFVRADLVGDHFYAPGSAEEHYEPARYFLAALSSGHTPTVGEIVPVGND